MRNGTIFLEPRLENFVTDAFQIFFETFARLNDWKLLYDSKVTKDKFFGDTLLINNMPVANYPWCGTVLDDALKFDGKVVVFLRDVHTRNNLRYIEVMKKLLDRADLILSFSNEHFAKTWHGYKDKHMFFPIYFAPTDRFYRVFDSTLDMRRNKCLVPGMICQGVYPLRYQAANDPILCCERMSKHPNYDKLTGEDGFCIRQNYADKLHLYCCALTDGSEFHYALQKHVEIPACGTLLLSDGFTDLYNLGFVPDVNFVEINSENLQETVLSVTSNPKRYQVIADNGKTLVVTNHTVERALIRFTKIMERV